MTATLDDVTRGKRPEPTAEEAAATELVRLAREQGLSLTGPDGLLKQLTKTVIETALNEEMTGHLGYEKHDPAGQGAGSGNVRNGTRPKRVLTDGSGQVEIDVPRDRAGTFEPQIVRKRQRRLTGVRPRSRPRPRPGWALAARGTGWRRTLRSGPAPCARRRTYSRPRVFLRPGP
jgi:putative transposase